MDYLRRACRVSRFEHVPNEEIRRRTKSVYSTVDRIKTKEIAMVWSCYENAREKMAKKSIKLHAYK